jgi:hypothetical protein
LALAKAGFTLAVRPVETLRPHEEIIPAHVQQLTSEMQRDGVQKDPMIIDGKSATVLDGMHRLAAFKELKVKNAVCCAVDYDSSAVTLRRWARVYSIGGEEPIGESADVAGDLKKMTIAEALSSLDRGEAGFALIMPDSAYVSEGKTTIEEAGKVVSAIDMLSERRGWQRSFVPEEELDVPLQRGRNLVLLMRRLLKDDVVSAAKNGRLLPCKTSMHRIDPRPVAIDFPIGELDGATNETIRDRLAGWTGRLVPANSVYEGRRYKERLLLLNHS